MPCGARERTQAREDHVSREAVEAKPRITDKVGEYLRDTRGELRKVNWPTRKQATNLTLIVLAVTVAMAIFLGAVDLLFGALVTFIVSL
jgi:preprotein translocase subunit SecE